MFHVGDKVKARYNTPYTITTNGVCIVTGKQIGRAHV